jgi:probable rRNA maturation factor
MGAEVAAEPTVVADDVRSDSDSPTCDVDIARWHDLALAALQTEGAAGELTLTFIDRSEIAELNEQYMGKSGPTDVLSFPLDEMPDEMPAGFSAEIDPSGDGADIPVLLGDIVVSPAVADAQYTEHAGTYEDELALLVVHGVLHILGHDHLDDDEAAVMRSRELALLTAHHWNGPAPAAFRQLHADD